MSRTEHEAVKEDLGRALLLEAFAAAVASVGGQKAVVHAIGLRQLEFLARRWRIAAVGKAASAMALGALEALGADAIAEALVVTKYGHLEPGLPSEPHWHCMESAHPVPDEQSLLAGAALRDFVQAGSGSAGEDSGLLLLISGGASSLVEDLREGLDLADWQALNEALLASAQPITVMNAVRPLFSRLKGGQLAGFVGDQHCEAMLISDVPGDDLALIGSGLVLPGGRRADWDAGFEALEGPLGEALSGRLRAWLKALDRHALDAEVATSQAACRCSVVASLSMAREAAAAFLRDRLGGESALPVVLDERFLEGDALALGRELAQALVDGPPGVWVLGGEPTVSLPDNPGRGGRNQALALAAVPILAGHEGVFLMSMGTDGSDGPGEDAGAIVDGDSMQRADALGLDVAESLQRADAGSVLAAIGDLVRVGPTGTNVMDLVVLLKWELPR